MCRRSTRSGMETDATIAGLGTLYTWNVVSPRLGITAKLTADGRTMLRASYGRFNQGVLTGELEPHPSRRDADDDDGVRRGDRRLHAARLGGRSEDQPGARPGDPHPAHGRVLGWRRTRSSRRRLAASAAYIRKSGANFIAWRDTGGTYREETRTLSDDYTVPVFVLTQLPRDRRFLLTNPADFSMDYHGLVVAMEKRMSSGWQAFGVLHVLACGRTAGVERHDGRRRAAEHAWPRRTCSAAIPTT